MALELKISQKLSQSLVMTPQLQQAIKLLQLGRQEYLEVIERELLENPLLEDAREESALETSGAVEVSKTPETNNESLVVSDSTAHEDSVKDSVSSDNSNESQQVSDQPDVDPADFLDVYGDSPQWDGVRKKARSDDTAPFLEVAADRTQGLDSHLLWQLRASDIPTDMHKVAVQIIGNVDGNGYLSCSLEEIAALSSCSLIIAERVLAQVQEFDPSGVAARDLRECLFIQLEQRGLSKSLAAVIVTNHLSNLEIRRYETIAKAEGVQLEMVYEAVKQIQKLEPRPGKPFINETPIYITPDIYVRKVGNEYVISLNESGIPRLRVSAQYCSMLESTKSSNNTDNKSYMQDRVRSATWLIKSIHHRQQTIFKVTESIMKFQRAFLEQGVSCLKPLVLREVAEDVGMHESTVSRVTTNKYVHTSWGVFELKYFFSSGIKSGSSEVSSESVKERLKELVAAENSKKPLSDQALVNLLKQDGIDIARRTVAKYREMLGILSSSRRKQVF